MRFLCLITVPLLLLLTASQSNAWVLKPRCTKLSPTIIRTAGTAVVIGSAGALSAAALWWNKKQQQENMLYTPAVGSLVGQTIVITGGTTGLGLESVKRLAMGGATVILTARSDAKGRAAVEAVYSYFREKQIFAYENQKIFYKLLDLDNLATVKQANWDDVTKIDVLLNNAGVMALPNRELTVDGFERQMQSNHLGHFALTSILSSKFSDSVRIINVSSSAHTFANQGLLFDYMWKADTGYSAWKSYGQSKLANIYFTQELQRRIEQAGLQWTTATLHPGVVATDLGRYMMGEESYNKSKCGTGGLLQTILMKGMLSFLKTPQQGATTQVWLASGAEGEDVRGKYFSDCKARPLGDFATDRAAASRLWKESEELTGVSFALGAPKFTEAELNQQF